MPRLPRDFHLVTTSRSADIAIRKKGTQHDTSKVVRLPRKMASEVSKVLRLPRKMQHIFWKCKQKYCACHTKGLFDATWNMMECHEVPRLPRKTTWSQLLTRQNSHVLAAFPIGTATLRPRRSQTDGCRTVANGCGQRLRTVTRTRFNPQTPKCKTRTLRYAFGKKQTSAGHNLLHSKTHPKPCSNRRFTSWLTQLLTLKFFRLHGHYHSLLSTRVIDCGSEIWPSHMF